MMYGEVWSITVRSHTVVRELLLLLYMAGFPTELARQMGWQPVLPETQVLFDKANGSTGVDDHQMALCESDNANTNKRQYLYGEW